MELIKWRIWNQQLKGEGVINGFVLPVGLLFKTKESEADICFGPRVTPVALITVEFKTTRIGGTCQ